MKLPGGLSGAEIARQAEALQPGIQVLMTSGYFSEEYATGERESPYPLLKKPYRNDELLRVVRSTLDG